MKVAIDSRKQNDYDNLLEFIDNSAKNIVIDTIVSGSAIVADRLVEVYAKVYGVPFLCKTNYHNFAKT